MFRSGLVATLSALTLTSCVTAYTYRNEAGQGDYYYSEPRIEGVAPYGGFGYGPGGWYGTFGYGFYPWFGNPYLFPFDGGGPYRDPEHRHRHGGGHRHPPPPPGGGQPPGGGRPPADRDGDGDREDSADFWHDPRFGARRRPGPVVANPSTQMPGGAPHLRPHPMPSPGMAPAPMPRMEMPRPPSALVERTERESRQGAEP